MLVPREHGLAAPAWAEGFSPSPPSNLFTYLPVSVDLPIYLSIYLPT